MAADVMDAETKALERPADHKADLRLWLRLLTCSTLIEKTIRRRLDEEFAITLPRFDLLAQLEKAHGGMTLSEVSRRMMVSNGNVTGLVERLAELGLVERMKAAGDRRVQMIRMTAQGHASFKTMALRHEVWIAELFQGLGAADMAALMNLLARTKASVRAALADTPLPMEIEP